MKYLGSSFTVALGGDAFREGYDRIDWRKPGTRPQSHETPDFAPELPNTRSECCKNCGQWKRDHHEVMTLGGPNLCCLKVEGAENLAMNEMIVLSERYWFVPEPEPKCKHCDQPRSAHFRGRDLGHFFEAED